ncbi:hypothetical protein ANN_16795 [Periplaneta americana]|uniref:Uncharacterized protein n=1 Tax=Periplaneta americana TaxID=6978 RepID=A0ABQ8SR41_PERAM|nr:hypothetical protein ANN_16795 [Periplaneta americana]
MAGLCEGGNEPPGSLKASTSFCFNALLRSGVNRAHLSGELHMAVLMPHPKYGRLAPLSFPPSFAIPSLSSNPKDIKYPAIWYPSVRKASFIFSDGTQASRRFLMFAITHSHSWSNCHDFHESLSSGRPVYVIDVYKLRPSNGSKERSRRARDLTVVDNLSAKNFVQSLMSLGRVFHKREREIVYDDEYDDVSWSSSRFDDVWEVGGAVSGVRTALAIVVLGWSRGPVYPLLIAATSPTWLSVHLAWRARERRFWSGRTAL